MRRAWGTPSTPFADSGRATRRFLGLIDPFLTRIKDVLMPRINKPWFTRIDYTLVVILALYSASQVLPFGAFDVFYPGWEESYVDLHELVDPWDGYTSSYVEIFGWYMLPVMIARHLATPLSWLGFACLALGHWW